MLDEWEGAHATDECLIAQATHWTLIYGQKLY